MSPLLKPIPLLVLAIGITLYVLGYPMYAAVAVFAAIGALALDSMRHGATERLSDPSEGLAPDERSLLVPIRRLVGEIEEVVEKRSDAVMIQTVGVEARDEARRLYGQIARSLRARTELRRISLQGPGAMGEISRLEERISAASNEDERRALASALDARRQELTHYEEVGAMLSRIDGGLIQAEAALSEIKARLAIGAGAERARMIEQGDELRETLGRLRVLRASYDEIDQVLSE